MLAEWWEKLNMLWCVCACTFYVWLCRDLNEHMPSMKSLAVDQNENMKNKVFAIRSTVSLCVYLLKKHMLAINHNNSANSVFIFLLYFKTHNCFIIFTHTIFILQSPWKRIRHSRPDALQLPTIPLELYLPHWVFSQSQAAPTLQHKHTRIPQGRTWCDPSHLLWLLEMTGVSGTLSG